MMEKWKGVLRKLMGFTGVLRDTQEKDYLVGSPLALLAKGKLSSLEMWEQGSQSSMVTLPSTHPTCTGWTHGGLCT